MAEQMTVFYRISIYKKVYSVRMGLNDVVGNLESAIQQQHTKLSKTWMTIFLNEADNTKALPFQNIKKHTQNRTKTLSYNIWHELLEALDPRSRIQTFIENNPGIDSGDNLLYVHYKPPQQPSTSSTDQQ
eukprot:1094158-Amphidinium_carterae.1